VVSLLIFLLETLTAVLKAVVAKGRPIQAPGLRRLEAQSLIARKSVHPVRSFLEI